MFVTYEDKCLKLTQEKCEEAPALECSHEEADTRLFMHAHHAARKYQSLVFVADDTGVFIICLSLSSSIHSNIYVRRGTKSRVRFIFVCIITITKMIEPHSHQVHFR